MATWMPQEKCSIDGMTAAMSSAISQLELVDKDALPDLRQHSEMVLASDYAGEDDEPAFQVLAYLLADRSSVDKWDSERKTIRQTLLGDARRIAFKNIRDRKQQKALGPFLTVASSINGVLFCVAVEKSVTLTTGIRLQSGQDISSWSCLPWKPKVLEKLGRISFFGGFLLGGLCRPKQNLTWITDDDEIVANERYEKDAGRIIGSFLGHFCPEDMGDIRLGLASRFDDERRAEDLISIVDLVGGAFSKIIMARELHLSPGSGGIIPPIRNDVSAKTRSIWRWLSKLNGPLKKVLCIVRLSEGGKLLVSFQQPRVRPRLPGEHVF